LHCFCLGARSTPHRVVSADDNGRLLYAARRPVTIESLRERGLPCTESQLRLLEIYDLLSRTGDTVQTTFPILDAASTSLLRRELATVTGEGGERLASAANDILVTLVEDRLAESAFAVVFGHALDGLLWNELRRREMLPSTALSLEHPFWRGAFWASYPKRDFAAGTNEVRAHGVTLTMVWTDDTADALAGLAEAESTLSWLESVASATGDQSTSRRPGGRRPVPLLHAGRSTRLSRACEALAARAADLIPDLSACRQLLHNTGVGADAPSAAVIIAHEIIWAVAERMMSEGLFAIPAHDDLDARLLIMIG
jgi:hypothetical protein